MEEQLLLIKTIVKRKHFHLINKRGREMCMEPMKSLLTGIGILPKYIRPIYK